MFITTPPNFYKIHVFKPIGEHLFQSDTLSLGLDEEQAIRMWANQHQINLDEIHQCRNAEWYVNDCRINIERVIPSITGNKGIREIWS